ncbi:MAG: HEAT repeat domain-containing protein [Gammaproteobacteria bacterium]
MTEKARITVLTARIRRAASLASGRRWFGLVPGLLLCNSVIAVPEGLSHAAIDGGAYSLDVDAHDGRVTVSAEEVPWKHLLDELTKQTGIRFHDAIAPRAPVTVSCMDMSVAQLLTCLWGGARMARYPDVPLGSAVSAWPAEVWLLGRPGALQPEDRISTVRHSDPLPPATHAAAAQHERRHLTAILDEVKSTHADARLQALSTLAGSSDRTDPAAQAAFRAALSDDVADVRAQGVWALSKEGGPQAIEVLRDALRDRDATVRLMAVDSTKADREGGMLLEQALADSDETVRTVAALKIREIEHQSNEERRRLADAWRR